MIDPLLIWLNIKVKSFKDVFSCVISLTSLGVGVLNT